MFVRNFFLVDEKSVSYTIALFTSFFGEGIEEGNGIFDALYKRKNKKLWAKDWVFKKEAHTFSGIGQHIGT